MHQSLGRRDVQKLLLASHLHARWPLDAVVVTPADAKVHVGVDVVKALGAQPLREVMRLCVDLEHEWTRCVKDAGDAERMAW